VPLGRVLWAMLVARWGSLTYFESQLGLNARIEDWEIERINPSLTRFANILVLQDRSIVLRRFIASGQFRSIKKGDWT